MQTRMRLMTAAAGAAVAMLLSAACGSGSAVPAGPSAAQPATGATIRGTVEGAASGSAGVTALSTGTLLRVSVVGTTLTTTTDASGQFVLQGVPSGRVELRFEGPGIDARLEIAGLQEGQEIRITVRVNGGQASVVPSASPSPDDDEAEIEGRLESISGTTLIVGGRTVFTDAATVVRRGSQVVGFPVLQVGQRLEVEGSAVPGGILARKIQIEDDDDDEGEEDDGPEVEFKGRIDSISAPSLVVAGRLVTTDASTRILDDKGRAISLSSLRVGDRVEVDGIQQAGTVLAKKIKKDD